MPNNSNGSVIAAVAGLPFLNQETKCLHSKHHHSLNNLRTPFRDYSGYICHLVFCFQNVQSSKPPTTISKFVALVVTSSKMSTVQCEMYALQEKGATFFKTASLIPE